MSGHAEHSRETDVRPLHALVVNGEEGEAKHLFLVHLLDSLHGFLIGDHVSAVGSAETFEFTSKSSPSVCCFAGYSALKYFTSSGENMFHTSYHVAVTDWHAAVRAFLRVSACDGKPPHCAVFMFANQHFNSVANVALSVRWPGWVKSSTDAVAK